MKRKIIKTKSPRDIAKRLTGHATFRITGPSTETGKRVTVTFEGTREEAEKVVLR